MPTFKTIHTNHGLQAMAAAEASGTPINLVQMAVGDGNGNAVTPVQTQTALVRELYRANVNRVYQPDPTNQPSLYAAELVIPASAGGFTLREVGVFDADGGMFVVGNLPATYKPNSGEGSYSDTVVRVLFMVTNAGVVTIVADPNVVVVTQAWVQNNITAALLIPGGLTNQVLTKDSNADGAFSWHDPSTANVVVDVIEEKQTLAALQTTVILAVVTTRGLAVYIEGVRLNKGAAADEWAVDPAHPDTRIILGQSYAAGTKFLATQNEPTGAVPFPLVRDQNLADVPDKAVARTNMGVYSKAEVDALHPAGAVQFFARSTAPTGWMKANGAAVSRAAYAGLFAAIGTTYGAGDGFTTFNLPDLRGEFVRGWDDGRGADPGRAMGSGQAAAFGSHAHTGTTDTAAAHTHTGGTDNQGQHNHTGSTTAVGDHQHQFPNSGKSDALGFAAAAGDSVVNGYSLTQPAGGHSHGLNVDANGDHAHNVTTNPAGSHAHALNINAAGGTETRPERRDAGLHSVLKQ